MALLKIDNVTKTFGGLTAVDNVNLQLNQGEVLGLIGPNGAGKTTLFNVVSGTFRPDRGHVIFDDKDITGKSPHHVCRLGISRTFQIVKPFAGLNVVDNVMVGAFLRTNSRQYAAQRAREIVEYVGLGNQADVPAHSLTIAKRKRLELARALATEPKLLLLDEVMAGLTPTESSEIIEFIRKMRNELNITLLVIEHVMKVIMSLSDRIAVLHHGQLIAVGSPTSIASDPGVIEAYLGKEFEFAKS
jgi:branched-chain amino acid transport system ATP-binding protein